MCHDVAAILDAERTIVAILDAERTIAYILDAAHEERNAGAKWM